MSLLFYVQYECMREYVCEYVWCGCVYIYVCVHICMYRNTYQTVSCIVCNTMLMSLQFNVDMNVCVNMCVCMCTYIYMCICICTIIYISDSFLHCLQHIVDVTAVLRRTFMCICAYMGVWLYIYTYTQNSFVLCWQHIVDVTIGVTYNTRLRESKLMMSLHMSSWHICVRDICHTHMSKLMMSLQGVEDPYDALSHGSLSAKEPLIIGLFCGKWPVKIRHTMTLRHSV